MRGEVWRLEWRVSRTRRRRLLWSVAVPVLLLAPVAASGAAAPHRAAAYGLFVVFFGLFGAAAPLVRDAERGWIERLLLTGYGPRPWLVERTASHAVQDLLQLLPALAAVLWLEGAAAPLLVAETMAGVLLALLAGNLLGTIAGAVVRSLAEGALVCASVGLAAMHLTGAFRPPAPGSWEEAVASASPFLPALEAMREVAGAAGRVGAGGAASVGAARWVWPAASAVVLFAAAWAAAPWIARRLTGAGPQL